MLRFIVGLATSLILVASANAQSMFLSISSDDFQITNVFSDIDTFAIDIEIDSPMAAGNYVNPDIISVSYSVSGDLVAGTPSGFPSFALQRDMDGAEFYAQGSSLSFEISPNAVLDDGIQAAELVGINTILMFNGREVGNGRFHPALFELDANGTGRIQNSDNVITEVPLQQVLFGEEYITDLAFDPGNATLITEANNDPPAKPNGGGALSPVGIGALIILLLSTAVNVKRKRTGAKSDSTTGLC